MYRFAAEKHCLKASQYQLLRALTYLGCTRVTHRGYFQVLNDLASVKSASYLDKKGRKDSHFIAKRQEVYVALKQNGLWNSHDK